MLRSCQGALVLPELASLCTASYQPTPQCKNVRDPGRLELVTELASPFSSSNGLMHARRLPSICTGVCTSRNLRRRWSNQKHTFRERTRRHFQQCHASSSGPESPPLEEDFFIKYEGPIRSLPLVAGGLGGLLVVLNRAVSGIAAVADASSAQSRADVLVLVLAATLLLTGLVWKSVQTRPLIPVALEGVPCLRVEPSLPPKVKEELLWAWDLLQKATRCRALVLVYSGKVALQAGQARRAVESDEPAGIDVPDLLQGKISSAVIRSGRANYLANLALFPGRFEFLEFLPENMQGLIIQPLGENGLLLAATDTVRGFSRKDQAWIATLAEKLDIALGNWQKYD